MGEYQSILEKERLTTTITFSYYSSTKCIHIRCHMLLYLFLLFLRTAYHFVYILLLRPDVSEVFAEDVPCTLYLFVTGLAYILKSIGLAKGLVLVLAIGVVG